MRILSYLLFLYYGINKMIELKNNFTWYSFIVLLITILISILILKKESERK